MNIDAIDRSIIKELSQNGRISITDLAKKVGLSKSPCQMRVKRLQEQKYILGYRAILDPIKLGMEYIAFVEVKLTDTTEKSLTAFNKAALQIDAIEQCHMIAGGFDYLLKIRTSNIQAYRQLLGDEISNLPNIAHTSTFVAMEAVKEDTPSMKSLR